MLILILVQTLSESGLIYLQHARFAVLLLVMQKKNIFNIATTHDIMWCRQLSEGSNLSTTHKICCTATSNAKKNIFNIATTHDIMWYRQLSESGLIYLQHTGFAAN